MKKTLALLLACCMLLALAACGGGSTETQAPASDAPATEAPATEAPATEAPATEAPATETPATDTPEVEIPPVEDLTGVDTSAIPGLEDGVLTIAMECAYAPYNWTQSDDSNGAVPIKDSTEYANGYDVMIAKRICEAYGWELEVVRTDWDSLVPGVQSGVYDAVIAGQSMTADRMEQVDFAGPYFYASIVCVTKADSPFAEATGISDLSGGTCTAQIATVWYDSMLPQIEGAQIQPAAETAPAMLMALETGTVDFICTDMPTALGAVAAYPDMVILDFTGSDDSFAVDEGEINIGVSVMKGNTELKDAIDAVLSALNADQFNAIMDQAIAIQPLSEG